MEFFCFFSVSFRFFAFLLIFHLNFVLLFLLWGEKEREKKLTRTEMPKYYMIWYRKEELASLYGNNSKKKNGKETSETRIGTQNRYVSLFLIVVLARFLPGFVSYICFFVCLLFSNIFSYHFFCYLNSRNIWLIAYNLYYLAEDCRSTANNKSQILTIMTDFTSIN